MVRRVREDFVPLIEQEVPGLVAYCVVEAENGTFATVTVCESKKVLEECSRLASERMRRYIADLFLAARTWMILQWRW